jgi:hypothetical protein
MKNLLTIVGLAVALFSWFNPLGLDLFLRAALFILGFDMMGAVLQILVFGLSFLFPFFGEEFSMFSWTLLIMVLSELVLMTLDADRPFRIIVKPMVVFVAVFISLGPQPALALAGTDLLINMTTKIKRKRKRKSKKKKK